MLVTLSCFHGGVVKNKKICTSAERIIMKKLSTHVESICGAEKLAIDDTRKSQEWNDSRSGKPLFGRATSPAHTTVGSVLACRAVHRSSTGVLMPSRRVRMEATRGGVIVMNCSRWVMNECLLALIPETISPCNLMLPQRLLALGNISGHAPRRQAGGY